MDIWVDRLLDWMRIVEHPLFGMALLGMLVAFMTSTIVLAVLITTNDIAVSVQIVECPTNPLLRDLFEACR